MIPFVKDKLHVKSFQDRVEMGQNAAIDVSNKIQELLAQQAEITMVFAAAPSQNEFLESLISDTNIEWNRINAFHMDEYIGLIGDAPQKFGIFLQDRIFDRVKFKSVHYINGESTDIQAETIRYSNLLLKAKIDIVCLGIGENGHIAFNDPHVADFNDKEIVKLVDLDLECRIQQVNDGCFAHVDDVPKKAITLTIPILLSATYMFCIVPGKTKAEAVKNTIHSPVVEKCPATILRNKENAILYLDVDSSSLLFHTDLN